MSARPRPPLGTRKNQPKWILPVAAGGIVLAGALAILSLRRSEPAHVAPPAPAVAPPAASAEAPSPELPFRDPAKVDPSDLYPKVKQRALAWNADARLVSITASPVVGDKVDLTQAGGEIAYVFGTDLAARVRPLTRLAIDVRRTGIDQGPANEPARSTGPNPRAAAVPVPVVEPNCVFDAAAKAAHASGIPATSPMKLRYEGDEKLKRGIWTAKVQGRTDLDRTIDGQTCAIVTRK